MLYHNFFTYRLNYNYNYKHQVFISHTKNSKHNDNDILYTRGRLATYKYFFINPNIG